LDPGKIRPISMIDENNNFYKYSAVRRRFDTYTKEVIQLLIMKKLKIILLKKKLNYHYIIQKH
jgi:hypothetical protein